MQARILRLLHIVILTQIIFAANTYSLEISETPVPDGFRLFDSAYSAPIVIDDREEDVVEIAASCFAEDVELAGGAAPQVLRQLPEDSDGVVIAGTVSDSWLIRQLVNDNKFDADHIQSGQWESFIITVVDEPFEGIDRALVIAGSDSRGTAFGLFELSKLIGVSPWVWWADVPAEQKEAVYIPDDLYEFGPPSVKYRGIFLNDEDWGLKPWASKTFDPELGDIGPKTYERVFELLLRLKANHIWPAMHACTSPFYSYPENKRVADKYSIVIGTSHCEPLLFNNATEWDSSTDGQWDYTVNPEGILEALDERVEEASDFENIYTVGIRGVHDTGMSGADTNKEGAELLGDIIREERNILSRHIDKDITEIPQVFIPYKEVLRYYDANLVLPEDITLMWADDNNGYITRFSDEQEQQRSGGGGVYYHISYLGFPHPYLQMGCTSPALIWREMNKAYQQNMKNVWIVNVGDLKRREWETEFFLQLAWDIDKWNEDNVSDYFKTVAERDIGSEFAESISDLMWKYYKLAFRRKPEHMGFSYHPFGHKDIADPDFSFWNNGDRVQQRIDKYVSLRNEAEQIYSQIPEKNRDAYFQLVKFPINAAAGLNEKLLHSYKSRVYAEQGRIGANYHAELANEAHKQYLETVRIYNEDIANGKWRHITSAYTGVGDGAKVFHKPAVEYIDGIQSGNFGIAIEGEELPIGRASEYPVEIIPPIVMTAEEANLIGDKIELSEDEDGYYLGVPEGRGRHLDFPTPNIAEFEFTVDIDSGGLYELYAFVDHPNPDGDSWYIQLDNSDPILWNDDVGSGKFKVDELQLEPGEHILRFYAREDGPKLRKVKMSKVEHIAPDNFLPEFNRYTREKYFIDVFNKGQTPQSWTAEPSAPWIELSAEEGIVNQKADRILVDVDYEQAPAESGLKGHIDFTSGDLVYRVNVRVYNKELSITKGSHIEDNGVISINAENYRLKHSGRDAYWKDISGLGRTGTAMLLKPMTGWYIRNISEVTEKSPCLEYDLTVTEGGNAELTIQAVPSFPARVGQPLRCAVSIDDRQPVWVTFEISDDGGLLHDPYGDIVWQDNVSCNAMTGSVEMELEPGKHKFRVWGTDPSVNIDKMVFDFGGCKESYLGPDETIYSYFTGIADLMDLRYMTDVWLTYDPLADIAVENEDNGIVNFQDFGVLAKHWLSEI